MLKWKEMNTPVNENTKCDNLKQNIFTLNRSQKLLQIIWHCSSFHLSFLTFLSAVFKLIQVFILLARSFAQITWSVSANICAACIPAASGEITVVHPSPGNQNNNQKSHRSVSHDQYQMCFMHPRNSFIYALSIIQSTIWSSFSISQNLWDLSQNFSQLNFHVPVHYSWWNLLCNSFSTLKIFAHKFDFC